MIAYITHGNCQLHDMGPHPEQPGRLTAINEHLAESEVQSSLMHYQAPVIKHQLLRAAHSAAHLERIEACHVRITGEQLLRLDADTAMNRYSLDAAFRAAGAAVMAVDLVMSDKADKAFCAVRPPGHHAERDQSMGFCLFNNIAVAAYHALNTFGLKRVAIVDFDVHHGNGTEDIVSGDERVQFFSTFQHPLYPGTGFGKTADNVHNTALDAGADGADFRAAVERDWLSQLADFAPQLVLVSAGFDAHQADPLGGLNFLEQDYRWISERLCEQATASAESRLVSTLEGGYHLQALASSVEAHLIGMAASHPL